MAGLIGAPLDRVDGQLKVTGAAPYAADITLAAEPAHAVLVQSTIARGRILSIDTRAAERAPGVIAVMTHENAPRLAESKPNAQQPGEVYPLLQDDQIHYNGQHVGLVVAESFEQATHAASLIRVRYAAARPVVRLEAALDRLEVPQNFRFGTRPPDSRRGEPEQAFASAPIQLDATYTTPVEHHNPMEPHAVIAAWDGDRLTLYHSTQGVFGSRHRVSELLGIPEENVHVISSFVGGGFGTKGSCWPHVTLAAMAAREVGRPVKLVLTRRQMYSSNGFRSKTIQRLRLGAERDGRLVATLHDGVLQTAPFGEFVEPVGLATEIMYSCPNLAVTHRVAPINGGMPTFMRAPGEASGMFALESAMDELAYAAAIDPLELRLRNYAERDERRNLPWSSKALRSCYRKGAAAFGWSDRDPRPRARRDGNTLIGWGMASATYPGNRSAAGATVRIEIDGRVVVRSGTQDIGTGTYTVMAQVAADVLGIAPARVRAELGDSDYPAAPVSGGSQSAASVIPAVQAAARSARSKLVRLATSAERSLLFGTRPEEIELADGMLSATGKQHKLTIEDALTYAGETAVEARETAKPGDEESHYSFHSFGAHFAEVRVDAELAEVRVSRYVGAFAAGRILNAKTARSQFIGGIVFGLGMALTEETEIDRRSGRILNANIAEYLVPVHADVPEITVLSINEDDPYFNSLGIKGVGELPIVGAAAAVANAVYHATGRRVRDLPIRPEKLLNSN